MQNRAENSGTVAAYLTRVMKELLGNHEQINRPGLCELAYTFKRAEIQIKSQLLFYFIFYSAFLYIT